MGAPAPNVSRSLDEDTDVLMEDLNNEQRRALVHDSQGTGNKTTQTYIWIILKRYVDYESFQYNMSSSDDEMEVWKDESPEMCKIP